MSLPTLTPAECAELQSGRTAKLALVSACPTKASQDMYAVLHQIAHTHNLIGSQLLESVLQTARNVLRKHNLT